MPAVIGVSTGPGLTAHTLMPSPASSVAMAFVAPSRPHLDAMYALLYLASPCVDQIEQMLTMTPCCDARMSPTTARMQLTGAMRLACTTSFHSAAVMVTNSSCAWATPTAFTS